MSQGAKDCYRKMLLQKGLEAQLPRLRETLCAVENLDQELFNQVRYHRTANAQMVTGRLADLASVTKQYL